MAHVLILLRRNIDIADDVRLAEKEVRALAGAGAQVERVDVLQGLRRLELGHLAGALRPQDMKEPAKEALVVRVKLSVLPRLIERATFGELIFARADGNESMRRLSLAYAPQAFRSNGSGDYLTVMPHQAIAEIASVVADRARTAEEVAMALKSAVRDTLAMAGGEPPPESLLSLLRRQSSNYLFHDVHIYKAKFFPRMVRALLNYLLPEIEGKTVLDPFVGSGTLLLEASRLRANAIGLDIDPLSAHMSYVKANAWHLSSDAVLAALEVALNEVDGGLFATRHANGDAIYEMWPHWLRRKMAPDELAAISRDIGDGLAVAGGTKDEAVRNLVRVVLSDAITRKIRMRFLGTGVGRFALELSPTPIAKSFVKGIMSVYRMAAGWEALTTTTPAPLGSCLVGVADAKRLPVRTESIDAIVTSPPYLPASSGRENYAKSKAPSLLSLGLATNEMIEQLDKRSVGGMSGPLGETEELRPHESHLVEWLRHDELREIKAEPTRRYFLEMRASLREIKRVLRPGSKAALVLGKQNTFYRFSTREPLYVVPSAELMAEEAEGVGLTVEESLDVRLAKINANARPRSLDAYYETILFIRK